MLWLHPAEAVLCTESIMRSYVMHTFVKCSYAQIHEVWLSGPDAMYLDLLHYGIRVHDHLHIQRTKAPLLIVFG